MTNDFFTPSGVPDIGPDTAAPASLAADSTSSPSVPAGVTAPVKGEPLDVSRAVKAAETLRSEAEKSRNDMMAPTGVEGIERDENGRFVGKNVKAEDPTATRPGADYAKADPAANKDKSTKGESGAKADVPATPTWRSTLAVDWGISDADADEAGIAIGSDFTRTIEAIQSGKINLNQQAQQVQQNPESTATKPEQAEQPKGQFEKYSEAEIKALEDSFDEDTAKLMQRMARQHNMMADRLQSVGDPNQIAQQVQQQASKQHYEHVNRTIVVPFFDNLVKQFPELAATYGGTKANQAQLAARAAHCHAAGQYMEAKKIQGKPVNEQQALQATALGWYSELFEKVEKTTERRASATSTRHRVRDIGASSGQNGARTSNSAQQERLSVHSAFLKGEYGNT